MDKAQIYVAINRTNGDEFTVQNLTLFLESQGSHVCAKFEKRKLSLLFTCTVIYIDLTFLSLTFLYMADNLMYYERDEASFNRSLFHP